MNLALEMTIDARTHEVLGREALETFHHEVAALHARSSTSISWDRYIDDDVITLVLLRPPRSMFGLTELLYQLERPSVVRERVDRRRRFEFVSIGAAANTPFGRTEACAIAFAPGVARFAIDNVLHAAINAKGMKHEVILFPEFLSGGLATVGSVEQVRQLLRDR